MAERTAAKKQRNFARADQIRNELAEKAWSLRIQKTGCAGSGSEQHSRQEQSSPRLSTACETASEVTMEANEAQELQEHAEHGSKSRRCGRWPLP